MKNQVGETVVRWRHSYAVMANDVEGHWELICFLVVAPALAVSNVTVNLRVDEAETARVHLAAA